MNPGADGASAHKLSGRRTVVFGDSGESRQWTAHRRGKWLSHQTLRLRNRAGWSVVNIDAHLNAHAGVMRPWPCVPGGTMPLPTANGESTDILAIANSPILWIAALAVFLVIIIQSIIYMRAARKVASAAGMTQNELKSSFRAGAVSALGPSLAVALVAISMLSLFGTPAVLTRIGLIGSAAYEVGAASIAAETVGAELGGPDYTQSVFIVAFFAMAVGGSMWMVATLILTPLLKRGDSRMRSVNPAVMTVVPSAALIGAFATLGFQELPKSSVHVVAFVTGAAAMGLCVFLAKKLNRAWLREWGLGFSIVAALAVAYFAATGTAPAA